MFLGSFEALPQSLALLTFSLISVSLTISGLDFSGAPALDLSIFKESTSAGFLFSTLSLLFASSALDGFCLSLASGGRLATGTGALDSVDTGTYRDCQKLTFGGDSMVLGAHSSESSNNLNLQCS